MASHPFPGKFWNGLRWKKQQIVKSWYIKKLLPEYNILQIAASSLGYKHTALTRNPMKQSYSVERRRTIGALYKGKTRTLESREKMSASARARTALHLENQKYASTIWNRKTFSKPTEILRGDKLDFLGRFSSLREACNAWGASYATFKKSCEISRKNTQVQHLCEILFIVVTSSQREGKCAINTEKHLEKGLYHPDRGVR